MPHLQSLCFGYSVAVNLGLLCFVHFSFEMVRTGQILCVNAASATGAYELLLCHLLEDAVSVQVLTAERDLELFHSTHLIRQHTKYKQLLQRGQSRVARFTLQCLTKTNISPHHLTGEETDSQSVRRDCHGSIDTQSGPKYNCLLVSY